MNIVCKNCNHHFKGHYCSNCGQTADTHRINVHFLWQDIKKGLFHLDEGIFYSFLQLFTRPGNSIREYIEGKRKNHFKPFSLVIVWATSYAFLHHYYNIRFVEEVDSLKLDIDKANDFITTHFAWITLLTIPFYALASFIVFRKQAYNFMEHLVLNAYLSAQRLSLHILLFPLVCITNGTPNESKTTLALLLLDLIFIIWTNTQFFNKLPKIKAFLYSLLSYLLFVVFIVVIILVAEISF